MDSLILNRAQVFCRHIGAELYEITDLTQQMAQALDRNDQTTMQLLLEMRAQAITAVKTENEQFRGFIASIEEPKDREHLQGILNGHDIADAEEQPVAKLAASNTAQLNKVIQMDKVLNQRVARDKSFYRK
jgi:hypothetical protein